MASKKFQLLLKSKVNATGNLSIPFSKARIKSDSLEEPLIFTNTEKDLSFEDIGETNYAINANNSNFDAACEEISSEVPKSSDDFEVVSEYLESYNASNVNNPLRVGVEKIGKTVNVALKDAHLAINSIMKDSQRKKNIRKPSEIVKSRNRFSNFAKKRYSVLEESKRSKSLTRDDKMDEVEENYSVEENIEEIYHDIPQIDLKSKEIELTVELDGDRNTENVERNVDSMSNASNVESLASKEESENTSSVIENNVEITNQNHRGQVEIVEQMSFTSLKIAGAVGAIISLFFVFSISKFILGLICGVLMSFGIFKIYESFFIVNDDDELRNSKCQHLRELPSPVIPHIEERALSDEYASSKASFSTWINSVNTYHPSWYNINASYSLHLSLEGTKMRLRTPKNKVPLRAMWNEKKLSGVTFSSERTVELLYSKVHLLPYGLVRRRMWSKKYPICVTIIKSGHTKSSKPVSLPHSKSYENLSDIHSNDENFFFFTRTCREKEEIFRRLMAASLGMPINLTITDIAEKYLSNEIFTSNPIPLSRNTKDEETGKHEHAKDDIAITTRSGMVKSLRVAKEPQIVTYVRYMAKFMPSDMLLLKAKSQHIDLNYVQCDPELLWLNALFGRIAWDVFRGNHWIQVIREKIQRKLKKLHLPYFIDKLEVIDIDLGSELPVVRKVSRPYLDYRGLWVEFEIVYAGGFSMGLETKINLMKLKNVAAHQKSTHNKGRRADLTVKYNLEPINNPEKILDEVPEPDITYDVSMDTKLQMNMVTGGGAVSHEDADEDKLASHSSSDDSFESSTDSDTSAVEKSQSSSNKSFMQWVDKIARSTYFQKAADNKYVQKTMEYVSNTSLVLQVDATYLNGTLVINIPPPPSDRLWWGFKKNPELQIKARPKVGQKEIQMTKVVEFIEKKLLQEFQRVVVMPNMDDIAIPLLLNGNPENYNQTLL